MVGSLRKYNTNLAFTSTLSVGGREAGEGCWGEINTGEDSSLSLCLFQC